MSEHMPKEPLPKSTHKPQPTTQAAPATAEGANDELIRLQMSEESCFFLKIFRIQQEYAI